MMTLSLIIIGLPYAIIPLLKYKGNACCSREYWIIIHKACTACFLAFKENPVSDSSIVV
jgi:hypothetical protein